MKHPWYKLADDMKTPVPCSVEEWCEFLDDTKNRIVAKTDVADKATVSTVFLGLDHSFRDDGPPVLFETMIFGIEDDSYQTRCVTWEESLEMHDKAVRHARAYLASN